MLEYWKALQGRYPIVARMARDVLAIPISTVASESAFSIGGRVLDAYRSSLKPSTAEALICLRDWIFQNGITLLLFFLILPSFFNKYRYVISKVLIIIYTTLFNACTLI